MDKLLQDAIAAAKAVRETALANAKLALEEAFTPHLKSMLSKKLQAEMEGEDEEQADEDYHGEDEEEVSEDEKRILSKFKYVSNVAILHTDEQLMPKRKLAWSSWNSILNKENSEASKIIIESLIDKYCK